jgi:ATP-dependent RNA helicase RhlE
MTDLVEETKWESLGLSNEALKLVQEAGYQCPTPVQAKGIPSVLQGRDLIASAQTGTGKTACFVLPMVEKFAGREGTFGIVLCPTREIAQQTQQSFEVFGTPRGVRSAVLIGGVDMRYDVKALESYPQVIVATPGRLCDHLDRGNLWLDYIQMLVLDEADRMLDMGFSDQLSRIVSDLPKRRQTLLFSATFPPSVEKLARKILYDPVTVKIGRTTTAAVTVDQRVIFVDERRKIGELLRLMRQETGSIMVFTRSKDSATRLYRSIHSSGVHDVTYLHSDCPQSQREQALAQFKEGLFRVIVATDVAGRGLHVDGVAHVVNYELPLDPEDYIHRIGRTGRAGMTGKATSFVSRDDRRLLAKIERMLGRELPQR